jgi:hypothetical protein
MSTFKDRADAARRRNAQKSTGPKTEAGKAKSRENALKHGLSGSGVVLTQELKDLQEERVYKIGARVGRYDHHSGTIEKDLALASLRVDACRNALRRRVVEQWDAERRLAVAQLAEELSKHPERVSIELECTTQGASWMIERLVFLADSLRKRGTWTEEEESLAFDLLGVPKLERRREDEPFVAEETLAAVESEIERLRALRDEVLDPTDAAERLEAELGVPHDQSDAARLYRRYEAENERKYLKLSKEAHLEVQRGQAPDMPQSMKLKSKPKTNHYEGALTSAKYGRESTTPPVGTKAPAAPVATASQAGAEVSAIPPMVIPADFRDEAGVKPWPSYDLYGSYGLTPPDTTATGPSRAGP